MSAKEVYLLTGGGFGSMKQMVEDIRLIFAATGKPHPKVAYVGTASLDNKAFFHAIKVPIMKAGAEEVSLVSIVHKNADISQAKRILSDADVMFISGGEVEDGIVWLKKFGLDVFLTELYRGGKLFCGASAGAIMMGQHWVHWDVEGDDSTSSLFSCLNFAPFVFDAHGEKEDWAELKCALRLLGNGAQGHGLSAGGFFSANERGSFTCLRNEPAVFVNRDGNIERIDRVG